MSARIVDYAFLNSRLSGMYAGILKPDIVGQLMKSEGVGGFFKVLRTTEYNKFLFGIRPEQVNTMLLELVLYAGLFDCSQKIVPYLKYTHDKEFMQKVLLIFELRNVKTVLMGKIAGKSIDEIRKDLMHVSEHNQIDIEFLLRTKDIDEAVDYLSAQESIGSIIQFAHQRYKKDQSIFVLDAAIDVHYLLYLYQGVSLLQGFDQPRLKQFFGSQMDCNNIIWALRLKYLYGLEPPEIHALLIPENYLLTHEQSKALILQENIPDAYTVCSKLPYMKQVSSENISIESFERGFGFYMKDMARDMYRRDTFCLTSSIAFLWIKKMEVADLVKILEGKEYNLSYEDIRKTLVFL